MQIRGVLSFGLSGTGHNSDSALAQILLDGK